MWILRAQEKRRCILVSSGQLTSGVPLLNNITVSGAFECPGMDFKEMDFSHSGNRYALVFQDYLSKWPEVYAVPDRKV